MSVDVGCVRLTERHGLATATPTRVRAALPFVHPGRVDVIGAGALIWRAIVARVATAAGIGEVVASERDILDGIAWQLAS